jgi:hypothetical protein
MDSRNDPRYPNQPNQPVSGAGGDSRGAAPKPPASGSPGAGVPAFSGPLPTGAPGVKPATPVLPPQTGFNPPPMPAQPISLNGRNVSYNPTTAPFGFDQSTPGVREQFWNNNQNMWFDSPSLDWVDNQIGQFQDPWAGEQVASSLLGGIAQPGAGQQFWNGIQGGYNKQTPAEAALAKGYQGPNNSQTAFDKTMGSMPGSLQPQFDAYYDRMADKAMSNVNSQSAARGTYGSNSALNNSIGAGLDVEAQRAKAATDFSLEDSANQRAWLDSLSNQGRNADQTGLDIFGKNKDAAQYGLDKTRLYGDLAFRAEDADFTKNKELADVAFRMDEHKADRLGAGVSTALGSNSAHRNQLNDSFDAAGQTQIARENRVNNLYGQISDFSEDAQNFVMSNYDKLIGGDQQMSDQELQTMIAKEADQRGWDQQTQERIYRDVSKAMEILTGKKTADAAKGGG